MAQDQHGSRFIQQQLEVASTEDKSATFEELKPHFQTLMTNVFGNYVVQKFLEHGSKEERWVVGWPGGLGGACSLALHTSLGALNLDLSSLCGVGSPGPTLAAC